MRFLQSGQATIGSDKLAREFESNYVPAFFYTRRPVASRMEDILESVKFKIVE